ncbi:hypothetical protein ABZ816_06595 [Actinosynnema sp. NPDC047251]|uniref:Uncharacterized protein n=1 Tax=Saccharothrix espanaensis (strain ATCC 51144 / DSM 44229 / JCM 9112 / NBRC 15066 / NRRL 15764) TaxID=1179773 RepID=K0JQF9_SACES|nr:hypothetical protein [Saccharothrix espanaensis]CCH27876.1 hypothetical protein BN6_05450 [Saccharothrix espanaensis DSM 44229]
MDVSYLRTAPTMAFPHGRLLAVRGGRLNVLAPDGWDAVDGRVEHALPLTRKEAEDWCEREGRPLTLLDEVPVP